MKVRIALLTITVAYHILIVFLSLSPPSITSPTSTVIALNDVILHAIAYLLLSILWRIAYLNTWNSAILSLATGTILEIIQYTIPWRRFSLVDLTANSFGVLVFLLFSRYLSRLI